jgi:glycosyltransferase involved in cell wall biosynthesis
MRIAVLTIFEEGLGGGAGRAAYDLARCLARHHDVALICPGRRKGVVKREGRLTIFSIPAKTKGNISAIRWNKKNLDAFKGILDRFRPDVIHANDFIGIDFYGMLYAVERKIPFFYTGHVLPSKCLQFSVPKALSSGAQILERSIIKKYLVDFFKNCDGIVTMNKFNYADHAGFCPKRKLYIIPNGKNLKDYEKIRIASAKSPKNLIFIGFLSDRKNQAFLIRSMKYLPQEYRLILVGSELYPGYRKKLERLAEENDVLSRVEFTGEVPYETIPKQLSRARVFVSASLMEVQSLVVLEALASGRPVVGLRNETISEVIDGSNGIALPRNSSPKRFADAVRSVVESDYEDYKKMCINARRSVKRFGWDSVEKQLIQMYSEGKKNYKPKSVNAVINTYKSWNKTLYSILYIALFLDEGFRRLHPVRIASKIKRSIRKIKNRILKGKTDLK